MLKGYDGGSPQIQQATPLSNSAGQMSGQLGNSFLQQLESFSKTQDARKNRTAQEDAETQAYKDAADGKPFSKRVNNIYGKVYNDVRTATYAADAEQQISNYSAQASIEFENDPEGYSNSVKSFTEGLSSNAPTSELSSVINIGGTKVRNHTYGNLKIAENKRVKDSMKQSFFDSIGININQVIAMESVGDMEGAAKSKAKTMAHINTMVDEGLIDLTTKQNILKDAEFKVTYGTAMNDMERLLTDSSIPQEEALANASAYLSVAKGRGDMDVNQNAKYADDLERMYNNAVKGIESQKKGNKELANLKLGNAIKVFSFGKTPSIDEISEVEALYSEASLSKQAEFDVQRAAYSIVKQYERYSLPQQEKMLADWESAQEMDTTDIAIITQVRKNLSSRKSSAKKDPQAQSVIEGRGSITALNVSNGPNAIAMELPNRVKNQQSNRIEFGEGATQLFTDAEATEFSNYLESSATSIEEKIAFIEAVNQGAPNSVNAVFDQLRNKGASVFSYAASMVSEGQPEVARGILRGQVLLKEFGNQEYIQLFKQELLSDMGNAMQYSGSGDRKALLDSSLSYSIFLAEQRGDVTDLKGSSERQAMNDLTNGMHKRNGQDLFLPKGTSKDDFDKWVDEDLTVDSFSSVGGITPDEALLLTQGTRGRLVSYGPGRYAVYGVGRKRLMNKDGSVFLLERN